MRRAKAFFREMTLTAAILAAGVALQTAGGAKSAEPLERWIAALVETPVREMAEEARRTRDDLRIQNMMQAAARIPGIRSASVLDREGRVLADADAAKIGKPADLPSGIAARRILLGSPGAEWGYFQWSSTMRPLRRLQRRGRALAACAAVFAGILLAGQWAWASGRLSRMQEKLAELEALLGESQRRAEHAARSLSDEKLRSEAWAAEAMKRLAPGDLLLDHAQRLAGAAPDGSPSGTSWQDLAVIREAGTAMARSIENPGTPVLALGGSGLPTLEFMSFADSAGRLAGTWIRRR